MARPGGPFNRQRLILGTSEIPVANGYCDSASIGMFRYGGPLTSSDRPRPILGTSEMFPSAIPNVSVGSPPPDGDSSEIWTGQARYASDAQKQAIFSILEQSAKNLGYDFSQLRAENQPPGVPEEILEGIFYVLQNERTTLVITLKQHLKSEERRFKTQYSYGISSGSDYLALAGSVEVRYCLTALSHDDFWWIERSSGIRWVAVYGINEICVVTLSGHVDWRRVNGALAYTDPKTLLSLFRTCVLSELEDLADPCSERRKELNRSFDVPFCVASATPDLDSSGTPYGRVHHDPSHTIYDYLKYAADGFGLLPKDEDHVAAQAIDFVRDSGLLPKVEDSGAAVRLAISAFERMIGKKFEAKEIEVTVLSGRRHGIPDIKDLDISEIGGYLSAIENAQQNASKTVV